MATKRRTTGFGYAWECPVTLQSPDWNHWKPVEQSVLLFLFRKDQVLLIEKKRGLGAGKITAPGGRLEKEENFTQAAIREVREETGLEVSGLLETASLSFAFTSGYGLFVKVFFADSFQGLLEETDEAKPFWHPVADLPWEKMWCDDALWLPLALEGYYATGRFLFCDEEMLAHEVSVSFRQELGNDMNS